MQFLKIIFWVLVLVGFAFLSASNWHNVDVVLVPQQASVSINLPLLIFLAFLVGFLPWYLIHRTTQWSLRRKLSQAKRDLEISRHVPISEVHNPVDQP